MDSGHDDKTIGRALNGEIDFVAAKPSLKFKKKKVLVLCCRMTKRRDNKKGKKGKPNG